MILSKKSRYGLTALIDLGISSERGQVALAGIAQRNGISQQYLEQIFAGLRRAGIVRSVKGPQGGYLLGRNPEGIAVSQVMEALDGTYHIPAEEAGETGIGQTIQDCVIDQVNEKLDEAVKSVTLADLIRHYREHRIDSSDMYYI